MHKKLNILVIDDDDLQEVILKYKLGKYTSKIDYAGSAMEALPMLKKYIHQYDLIISDIEMPLMSGFELARYVRQVLQSNVPLVAHTSLSQPLALYHTHGFDGVLSKTFNDIEFEELLSQISAKKFQTTLLTYLS